MKFKKDLKTPDAIPQVGIERAVTLMETGRLYRYNFHSEFERDSDTRILDGELASEVAQLESEFSGYTGHKYVIAVNSCGSALFLSLKAAGIEFQDKVLTNAFTFTAVPSSIVHAGGVPVYVECNHQYLIDMEDLKSKIQANPDAKFFVLSHMRGHISDVDAIKEICDKAGIYLIEDCAHSLGAKWYDEKLGKYKLAGHHGQISCFSSQSYKLMNSGEGGFVATHDAKIAAYCILAAGSYETLYKKHISRPFDDDLFESLKPQVPNFSLRMNNLNAAVLRPQIPTLEGKISQYNQKYDQLVNILATVDNISIPSPLEKVKPVRDSIQFNLVNFTPEQADKFLQQTAERGVKMQIFGRMDNARYFKNWEYSFENVPTLEKTEDIICFACDLRLSLSFTTDDINLIGYIIKDVVYKIVASENKIDYKEGLTDNFQGVDEVISKYDKWVSFYDQEHHNNGWKILLNYFAYILKSHLKSDDKILDVGCGTGLLAKELISYGFRNLHGIDISEQSLIIARKFKIYQDLSLGELGNKLDFADNSFDAWVSSGVFTRKQVPLNAFEELIRILKPGGLIMVGFRVEDNDYYYDKIKEYCAQNVLEEVWKNRLGVLKSCNHDLVIFKKTGTL